MVCTRALPKFDVVDPTIASFTFDAQGRTSFDVGEDGGRVEMEQHAVEIMMHVIEAAVRPVETDINQL